MSSIYKKSPLIEATCEIIFDLKEWDATYFGNFYELIKREFPYKKTKQSQGYGFVINEGSFEMKEQKRGTILECTNNKENQLIQLTETSLSITFLPPYEGWKIFKPLIKNILDNYVQLANPASIKQIRLTYTNKIDVKEESNYENIKKYFNFIPSVPKSFTNSTKSITNLIEIPIENDLLIVNQVTLKPEELVKAPVLLAINFICQNFQNQNNSLKDQIDNWIEKAHTKIETVFEDSITDFARNSFNEAAI